MEITWMGTASFRIEAAGERILVDPFVELRQGTNPNCLEDFFGEETIFITHGHFDHLYVVPSLLDERGPTVFCTELPARTLSEFTDETDTVAVIAPGMCIPIGELRVNVYRAKHIEFEKRYLPQTLSPRRVLKYLRNLPFLFWANKTFQEGGEIVAFGIEAEGRRVLLLGSLNLDETEDYPTTPDLLILPYQGNNDLVAHADRILERIRPKRVLLSHFDNAFPPESRDVDLRPLKRLLAQKYPQIQVVKPRMGKTVRLS